MKNNMSDGDKMEINQNLNDNCGGLAGLWVFRFPVSAFLHYIKIFP